MPHLSCLPCPKAGPGGGGGWMIRYWLQEGQRGEGKGRVSEIYGGALALHNSIDALIMKQPTYK